MKLKRNEILIDNCTDSYSCDCPNFYLKKGCTYAMSKLPEDWTKYSEIEIFDPTDQIFGITCVIINPLLNCNDPLYEIEVRFIMNMLDAPEQFVKENLSTMHYDGDESGCEAFNDYNKVLRTNKIKNLLSDEN